MSVVLMEAEMGTMSGIPNTPKRFRNWLDKQKDDLPTNIYQLGIIHWLSLNMISMNRSDPDALKAARRISAAPMKEFMTAYAEWSARR